MLFTMSQKGHFTSVKKQNKIKSKYEDTLWLALCPSVVLYSSISLDKLKHQYNKNCRSPCCVQFVQSTVSEQGRGKNTVYVHMYLNSRNIR